MIWLMLLLRLFIYKGAKYRIRIKRSCNSLLLCKCENDGSVYFVCNPTTHKYTLFPHEPCRGYSFGAYLAFDPSKSPHYKVVLHNYYRFAIYSSENASWKQIAVSEPLGDEGAFWNGAIHWLSVEDVHFRFDVDAEKLIKTPIPSRPKILSRQY
ncbi:hypothetical protein ACSBR2_025320 [Camellia fascicularis]